MILADGSLKASIYGNIGITGNASVSGTVGASIIGLPPVNLTQISGGNNGITGNGAVGTNTLRVAIATDSAGPSSVVAFQGGTRINSGSILAYMAPLSSLVSGVTSIHTLTTAVSVLAAAPGAQRNYITAITVTNGAASSAFVDIVDGATVIWSGFAAASGGGFAQAFPTPLRQPTQVAPIEARVSAQASVKVAISGFTAA